MPTGATVTTKKATLQRRGVTTKEIEIIHRLFLVNCYILHIPRFPSQPASNVGALAMTRNNLK